MKLILLPGMDGTGILFTPLIHHLDGLDTKVIPLPNDGPQDYSTLSTHVASIIGDEECIIIAESFSGGIVETLLRSGEANIKHVIFFASFLSCPSFFLLKIAIYLPLQTLLNIPLITPFFMRLFCLGHNASADSINLLKKAISLVPAATLKARMRQASAYKASSLVFHTPATYIHPKHDLLVSDRSLEFVSRFNTIELIETDGPHFIIQSQPKKCSNLIKRTS
ncbi:hypothetical protein [Marinobacterium stanieri]|uniref:hypothetical protein n=1 Tax=Marinobacterium stanieri TaxID=49186 RepID=UPI003A907732